MFKWTTYVKGAAKRGARARERDMTGCLVEQASYVGASYVGIRDKLFKYLDFGAAFPGALSAGREVVFVLRKGCPLLPGPPHA